ncbi:hypothetical protein, partial [Pseudomonas aeruginosa]|uniref:hypothetical protein n=1 Tax=Pseudomonas aeruginosa TaxID=287 RepID=UPI001C3D2B52
TPASGEPRRGLRSAAAVELLTSFCLCFLKKPVRQDGVYGAVTVELAETLDVTGQVGVMPR